MKSNKTTTKILKTPQKMIQNQNIKHLFQQKKMKIVKFTKTNISKNLPP